MATVRLGCQANAWQREFKVIDNLGEALRQVKAAGYEGVEIGVGFIADLDQPALLRDLLQQHELAYAAVHVGGRMYDRTAARERTLPDIRRAAAFGSTAGAEAALISTGAKRDGPLTDDEHAANIEGLREASRIVRDHGLIAYYHNHAYEFADDAVVLQRIMDGVPPELLNLAFDTANAAALLPAAQVPAVIRRYRERIGFMHYKDCRGAELVEALGDGEIDFADVAGALREIDFSGWVVAELEGVPGARRTVADDTRRSYELMRRTLLA